MLNSYNLKKRTFSHIPKTLLHNFHTFHLWRGQVKKEHSQSKSKGGLKKKKKEYHGRRKMCDLGDL